MRYSQSAALCALLAFPCVFAGCGAAANSHPNAMGGIGGGAPATGGVGGSVSGTGGNAGGRGGSSSNEPDAAPPSQGQPTLPSGRGAIMTFVEYEAEAGDTNGTLLGPSRKFTDVAAEASGREAVRLSATGQYVSIVNLHPSNSIVVRYSIPDSGDGQGLSSTIGVYVDGKLRTRLPVTSRYAYTYGDFGNGAPNSPSQGKPHHYFDESHALIGDIAVGATVMLRKDAQDSAAHYDIDLIDMEQVGPPIAKPSGYLSITDFGATPDDDGDDSAAIQSCIDQAIGQNRGVYIPQGTFKSIAKALSVKTVTIQGAGMWYSMVSGANAHFDCWGGGCKYHDLAVFGDTTVRDDASSDANFSGNGSSGVVLENVWMEHSKVGYWTGPDTDGLTIRACRIRDLYADGVNLFKGTKNSIVENTHLRNTGDDALAMWSPSDGNTDSNNTFQHNYVQLPWMANCFGIYGGDSPQIEDNVCADTVQYPGILLARQFNSHAFTGTALIQRNTLIRAGGPAYNDEQGAFKLQAAEGPLQNVKVSDLDILDPTYSGIHIQGGNYIDTVYFDTVKIDGAGTSAIRLTRDANGAADASNVVVANSTNGGLKDDSGGKFTFIRGTGNSGW